MHDSNSPLAGAFEPAADAAAAGYVQSVQGRDIVFIECDAASLRPVRGERVIARHVCSKAKAATHGRRSNVNRLGTSSASAKGFGRALLVDGVAHF